VLHNSQYFVVCLIKQTQFSATVKHCNVVLSSVSQVLPVTVWQFHSNIQGVARTVSNFNYSVVASSALLTASLYCPILRGVVHQLAHAM
jgi:hypothetical protein